MSKYQSVINRLHEVSLLKAIEREAHYAAEHMEILHEIEASITFDLSDPQWQETHEASTTYVVGCLTNIINLLQGTDEDPSTERLAALISQATIQAT